MVRQAHARIADQLKLALQLTPIKITRVLSQYQVLMLLLFRQ